MAILNGKELSLSVIVTILVLSLIPTFITLTKKYGFNTIKSLVKNMVTTLVFIEDKAIGSMRGSREPLVEGLLFWIESNANKIPQRTRLVQFINGKKFNSVTNECPIWFKTQGIYIRYIVKPRFKGDFGVGLKCHELVLLTTDENKIKKLLEEIKPDTQAKNRVYDFKPSRTTSDWIDVGGYQTKSRIFLDHGVKDNLEEQLIQFKENQDWYLKHGLPWKFTILLHGKSGAGKSSIIIYLARFLDCSIYRTNLESVPTGEMMTMIKSIPPGSILALEDFDDTTGLGPRLEKTVSEEKIKGKLTEFLNTFRGIVEINGLITVLTTNHIELLDPAILNAGRVDKMLEIKEMHFNQIKEFYEFHYNVPLDIEETDYTPLLAAEVSNAFVLNPLNCEEFKAAILNKNTSIQQSQ